MALRVLVVEDGADGRASLALLLGLSGFQVDAAADGPAALSAAQAHSPDVVLMDLGRPGYDAYQAAQELRGLCRQKPLLVALTGYHVPSYRGRPADEGFDYYLVKPVDPGWLVRLFQNYEGKLSRKGS